MPGTALPVPSNAFFAHRRGTTGRAITVFSAAPPG